MEATSLLEDASKLAGTIESVFTAVALVIGGIWAYFKFIKDRVYRPRLDVHVEGSRLAVQGRPCLLCKVSVKNIGTSKVALIQQGTGLGVYEGRLSTTPYESPEWDFLTVLRIFEEHGWFESGETIRHESLVTLPEGEPRAVMLQTRLVCKYPRTNIAIHSRCVVPPQAEWTKDMVGNRKGDGDSERAPTRGG